MVASWIRWLLARPNPRSRDHEIQVAGIVGNEIVYLVVNEVVDVGQLKLKGLQRRVVDADATEVGQTIGAVVAPRQAGEIGGVKQVVHGVDNRLRARV